MYNGIYPCGVNEYYDCGVALQCVYQLVDGCYCNAAFEISAIPDSHSCISRGRNKVDDWSVGPRHPSPIRPLLRDGERHAWRLIHTQRR